MISDVDLKDWDFDQLKGDCHSDGPKMYLYFFVTEMEKVQKQGKKQIAALFQPPKGIDV